MSLTDWLDTATRPFPESTRGRLRADFASHLADTVAALTAEGHSDPAREALHRLGDPREVRRELERTHYTATELEWLDRDQFFRRFKLATQADVLTGIAINACSPLVLGWLFHRDATPDGLMYGVYLVGLVTLLSLDYAVGRRLTSTSATIAASLLRRILILWTIVLQGFLVLSPRNSDPDSTVLTLLALGAIIGIAATSWPRAAMTLLPKALRNAL